MIRKKRSADRRPRLQWAERWPLRDGASGGRVRRAAPPQEGQRATSGVEACTMKIFNLNDDPEWDRTEEREGWRIKDAWVGAHIDAELMGASMYEVEPGDKQGPFHTHHANEEWVIVLRGEPTVRTHEGDQQLREGDVVAFPRGKEGAHQIKNTTDTAIRVLVLSTLVAPDIVEYLDSGKIGARSVKGERILLSRPGPDLDYWEGED
jgi:uncharacterized cupin superfamily protein